MGRNKKSSKQAIVSEMLNNKNNKLGLNCAMLNVLGSLGSPILFLNLIFRILMLCLFRFCLVG